MDEDLNHLQQPEVPTAEVNERDLDLHPYMELAKYVTESPVCKISITDTRYQGLVAQNVDEALYSDRLYNDTINQNGTYQIDDLSKDTRYKNHSYVTESPHFRYYCGAKLTTGTGKEIGSICVLDVNAKRVSDKQKKKLQYLALLVADAIEHEARYRGMTSKLEALSDSIHKINHDLRTPVTGIAGISELLIKEKGQNEFPARELTLIKKSAEAILNVIDKMLEDEKTGHDEHQKREDSHLGIIIKQLKHLYHPPAKTKGVSLTFTTQVDPSLKVSHSYALKLIQIVGNLLSNAVKFTPENGAVGVTINKTTGEDETMLVFIVKNTGKSMSADQIEAFNNGNEVAGSAGTNGEQSFGKGLKYVKEVVGQAGGTISVKAERKKGTQFTISLPVPVDNTNKSMSSLLEDLPKSKSNGTK